jgi:glutamate 5-kinase
MRLADGRDPAVLEALLAGEARGTLFRPNPRPLSGRKGWLAHALLPKGSITVDAGAEQALLARGASLLAAGVRQVQGSFAPRDPVQVLSLDGRELARGLAAIGSADLQQRLGQRGLVVHRDHLVLTANTTAPAPPTAPA